MLSFWSFVVPFLWIQYSPSGEVKIHWTRNAYLMRNTVSLFKETRYKAGLNSRHNKLKFSHVLTFQSIDLSLSRYPQTKTNIFCIMVTSFKYIELETRYNLKEWIFLYHYSYLFMKGLLVYSIYIWGNGSKRRGILCLIPRVQSFELHARACSYSR